MRFILAEELRMEQMHERFDAFADIAVEGAKFMSYQAFVDSIINKVPSVHVNPIPADLEVMFNLADTNGDRLISFKEYSFFVTLLSCNARELKTNFLMMDKDGSGSVDLSEFVGILQSQQVDRDFLKNFSQLPLVRTFFGEDGTKQLPIDQFVSFIHELERCLLKCEFQQFDKGTGKISINDFITIIHQSVYYNKSLNPNFQEQVLNLEKGNYMKSIDYSTYVDFYVMSQYLDDIELAIEYYTVLEIPMTKENFHSALLKITKVPISKTVVDLVFAMFGQDAVTKELKKGTSFIGYRVNDKEAPQSE
jgi:Ca2+-binding EF-hand superfamily protein